MKEYIERAMAFAVLVDFPGELSPENIGLAVARKAIDALPAADVAEVVRCKDCQYYQDAKTNKKGFLICQRSEWKLPKRIIALMAFAWARRISMRLNAQNVGK